MMDKHSFSYVERVWALLLTALLRYVIGCPCCMRTAPMPLSLASVSTINPMDKSGNANTGVVTKVSFKVSK
jgi:hypothetical protein